MKVNEMFCSLSGEGVHAGIPTVFVRLTGCNLRCAYCDTQYAYEGGEELSIAEVKKRVSSLDAGCKWVLVTGGDPLYQSDSVHKLVIELKRVGYFIEIEENGSFDPPEWFSLVDSWSIDVKCPCSGLAYGSFRSRWLARLRKRDQLKFVCGTREDLDFVHGLLNGNRCRATKLISPLLPNSPDSLFGDVLMSQRLWLQEVWNFCVQNNFRWSFQQHRIVWGSKKGV